MKRYIIIFAIFLCTACSVSEVKIHPVPTPNYHPSLAENAFGKLEAEYHSSWMYYLGNCDEKKCEK